MQTLDALVAVGLLVSLVLGAWRGLMFELISLAGWVLAFFAARFWGGDVASQLPLAGASAVLQQAVGFVVVFVGGVMASGLVAAGVKKLLAHAGLRPADRALGALFGLARGVLLALVCLVLAQMTPLRHTPAWSQSWSVPVGQAMLAGLQPILPAGWIPD